MGKDRRNSNVLRNSWTGSDGKGALERRACSKFSGGYPDLQLDRVTTYMYLKRELGVVFACEN